MKVYLDTSVFGGFFDKEFQRETELLFELIGRERIRIVYSSVLEEELDASPKTVQLLANNSFINADYLHTTEEMLRLADLYIKEGALTKKSLNDARHIAIATLGDVSAIISWNFKHMANFVRVEQYNAINSREGYRNMSIYTPREIINNIKMSYEKVINT